MKIPFSALLCVLTSVHAADEPVQRSWKDHLVIGETENGTPSVLCWYTWRGIQISMVIHTNAGPPCPTTMRPTAWHEQRAEEWARQRAMRTK